MNAELKIFSKEERNLLKGILRGSLPQTKGVPIRGYSSKIAHELARRGLDYNKRALLVTVHRGANDQAVWRAAYTLVQRERPGLLYLLEQAEGVLA